MAIYRRFAVCEILTRVFCHVQSNNLSVHVRECRADNMEGGAGTGGWCGGEGGAGTCGW